MHKNATNKHRDDRYDADDRNANCANSHSPRCPRRFLDGQLVLIHHISADPITAMVIVAGQPPRVRPAHIRISPSRIMTQEKKLIATRGPAANGVNRNSSRIDTATKVAMSKLLRDAALSEGLPSCGVVKISPRVETAYRARRRGSGRVSNVELPRLQSEHSRWRLST